MLGPHKAELLGALMAIFRDYVCGRRVIRHFLLISASLDLLRTNKCYKCLSECTLQNLRPKSLKHVVEIDHRRLHFRKGNEMAENPRADVSLREHKNRAAVSS